MSARHLRSIAFCVSSLFAVSAMCSGSAQTVGSPARDFLAAHPSLHVPVQGNRVPENASFVLKARIAGHTAPYISQTSTGAPSADAPIRLTVLLARAPEVQAAFEQLLQDQQNPGSPLYHQWLTPQQIGSLYGPTQADISAVSSWLSSSGFQVEAVDPTGTRIRFVTTFGMAASVLQTRFANFAVRDRTLFSVTEDPSVPSALTGVIQAIGGLSQKPVYPQTVRSGSIPMSSVTGSSISGSSVKPEYTYKDGSHYMAPGDFNIIYDVKSVLSAGYTGAGQRVAVIGQSRVNASDVSNYEALFGLPSTTVNTVIPTDGVDPGVTTSDGSEQTLDVERVLGVVPNVGLDLVVSGDTRTDSGLFIALDWNVNNLVDKVMSISYGTCEADYSASDSAQNDSYFGQAAAEGITTLASSGDSGVQGCSGIDKTFTNSKEISGLCASQYVTCVGGTEFAEGSSTAYWSSANATYVSAVGYIPEGAWNDPTYTTSTGGTGYQQAASGGGPSLYVAKPSWQTGTGVPADGKRDVPDISFASSADHDGYLICLSPQTGCSSTDSTNSGIAVYGGTSAAAPGMAGIVALLNQRSGSTAGFGTLNPTLYRVAASTPAAFHDASPASSGVASCDVATPSMCNNSTPGTASLSGGVQGYALTAGYDEVTGLGSLDVANFLNVAAPVTLTSDFTIAPVTSSLTLSAGATTSNADNITIASSNGFAGAVTLSCAVALSSGAAVSVPPTCALNTSSVTLTANGSTTVIATIGTQAASSGCTSALARPSFGHLPGIALASLLMLALPWRKRRSVRSLLMFGTLAIGLGAVVGCGDGGSVPSSPCSTVAVAGTTKGTYTVSITGTSGVALARGTFQTTVQ